MDDDYRQPVYTIGIAAKMLGISPATLRIWEKRQLIKPARIGKNRFYSKCDLDRLAHITKLLQEKRMNIEGVRAILDATRCWELKKCSLRERESCPVYLRYAPI